ncbi:MAG: hypothetical protein IKM97_00300 [Clostridia bacterium]|nr:hypothetical protein [Clostridia bacterium]
MKFGKLTKSADLSHIIECDLQDDILFRKMPDEILDKKTVKLKEGQYAILYKAGKIYDAIHKKGIYEIEATKQAKTRKEMEKWRGFVPPKPDNSKLCVIFFNLNEIKNNNFNITKPIQYVDFTKEEPLKAIFTCTRKI